MEKTIEEIMKDFLGTKRWEKYEKPPKELFLEKEFIQGRDFLIEKYKSKFPFEQLFPTDRIRL